MKRGAHYILVVCVLLFGTGLYSLNADYLIFTSEVPELTELEPQVVLEGDSLDPRYPVAKTVPEAYDDLIKKSPMDLRNPDNVKTSIEYDLKSNTYIVTTKLGDMQLSTPISLTPEEYQDYSLQESLRAYFRQKNEESYREEMNKELKITDIGFDLGAAEKIFGKGGVRVKTQGTAEIKMGLKSNKTDNPSLPQRSRNRTFFNFEEQVQLNVQATVGEKVNFGMNYNTETTFDYDSKKLKLAYEGTEDEIIKVMEAGNVSMNTSNSLIRGGAALFGIKTELQFGKLRVGAIFSQQESESQTVSAKGGVQTKPYEFAADQYDENRHFFLSHFFRDTYDAALSKLPYINSGISISRVEVWITNKRSNYDQSRNIVAFSDLAENSHISNPQFNPSGSLSIPYNGANTLYQQVVTGYPEARNINTVSQAFAGFIEGGTDYEKVESARKLDPSEFNLNKQLGYISLKTQLQPDEVLAVAYEYTYRGSVYQVGEFSTDNSVNTTNSLYVKLLKGTAMSPGSPFWDLMMKNVYSLGAYAVNKEKFRLDILYQSDTTGVYLRYLSEGNIKDELLLRVMNLDRLDAKNETYPDGIFDYLEGYTVLSENGRVFFPVVEPFGSHLRKKIGNDVIADKYVFQELYDSTLTVARQLTEKNKFLIKGEYKASSSSEIQLGASNVARGSVRVTAAGVTLQENVDYTVDYTSGIVTILNENIISSGTAVSVSLENQSAYSMQRKTMMGVDLNYEFNKNFNLGATIMHLSELPLTTKTAFGDESIKNTLWGLNTSYKTESQWLTNLFDKLPLLTLTKPSQISLKAEFANLIPGHYENKYTGGYSYLDDFESTQTGIDLLNPYPWTLSSVPYSDAANSLFPEASLTNNIDYGKNRALLAWYYIDGLFTRKNSSIAPNHIKNDLDQLSNHYVREVKTQELFPNKDLSYNENNTLPVLNLAYYPTERGPYNLDADRINADGSLAMPDKRWGGIMRKIEQSDFEAANIEYIEFWMMDPFIYNANGKGGDLYFNLGEISEDILRDEKKFFENGLPIDGDLSSVEETVWGRVPKRQSTVYAFDNTQGARKLQDVGFNGLSSADEKQFSTYQDYLSKLQSRLSGETLAQMMEDPFSPFNDPAGDDYHYFRGSDYDVKEVGILERYKRYNGVEGNSTASEDSPEKYDISARTIPDVEDINQDNTLNEFEKYYQYKVSLRPKDLVVGNNYIVDRREVTVNLRNGKEETIHWYQFKIPVKNYSQKVGSINDFKTIRFMRMFMTDFSETTVLRFGSFDLVRGEWRNYTQDLSNPKLPPVINASLDVSTVNIEENSERTPVNYVLPPGVSRMLDPGQPQLRQQNEQALSMKITNLAPADARAVYKNTYYDLRQYKRLQLFVHAEKFINDVTNLSNGEMSVFIRLGSDYKNNYYEYEVPLLLTPHGNYSTYNETDQFTVWPQGNTLNFDFEVLTNLKLNRNKAKREGNENVTFYTPYSEYDPASPLNKITIVGNPSLSEVKTIMIGVRNNSKDIKSGEFWVNELRLTDFNEDGGWAANANLQIALSDFGTLNMGGRVETAGFGGLDQSIAERRLDDYAQYNMAANVELGKLFPEKTKVSIPLYYAYSKETTKPKYNPLDQDIVLQDALNSATTKHDRDSILDFSQDRTIIKSVALNNVKVDVRSKTPMPYDPANFSVGYSFNESTMKNPETQYETSKDYRANFSYSYSPYVKPFTPFKNVKEKGSTRYLKEFGLNYLPSNISFQSAMMRNYYEQKLRNLDDLGGQNNLPVSFSSTFYWDRAFSLRWDFTKNLNINFTSGTNARIEEPNVQVNKELNPDQYKVWKDSVKQSISDMGKPMKYDQTFTATYTLPFALIPVMDWTSGSLSYNASYNWERGAEIDSLTEIGNTITNQRQFDISGRFNLVSLYNKNKFLAKVNQKFTPTTRVASASSRNRRTPPAPLKVEKDIKLSPDSTVKIRHSLASRKVRVSARGADGKVYAIKFKAISAGEIEILNLDTTAIKVSILPGPDLSNELWYKVAEHGTRFLMMLRSLNIQYAITDGMMLPGFRPEIGDFIGQSNTVGGTAPGLGFAFGSVRRSYIDEADENDWLIKNEDNVSPAIINHARNFTLRATLEPISGLKIDLNANRVDTRNTEIKYMYQGMPETYGGNFTMTTIAASTAFKRSKAIDGYNSETFNTFLANREVIASRLGAVYNGLSYPDKGFLAGSALAGQPYNSELGNVGLNSSDVLIPAFLAAYTGKNATNVSLSPFPSLSSLLPNWRVTYDGLIRVGELRKYFKSVLLNHQYRCSYSVGAFSSFLNWVDAGQDDLGFIRDVLTNNPLPSSPYEISAVSITEGFSPLIGVDVTFQNNVTARSEYRTTRNLSLNISSYQLVEAVSNEYVIGLGYKLTEFNKVLKMKQTKDFSNDLTVRLDFSYRKSQSLIRKIEDNFTQPTSGNIAKTLQLSADYGLSKTLSLRAFYDLQINEPLVSSASYPTSNSNYGISLRFSLAQ